MIFMSLMSAKNIIKPVIQSLRAVAREQGGERATFQAVMSAPVIQAYLADYFSRDFYETMQTIHDEHSRPAPWPGPLKANANKIMGDGGYWEAMSDSTIFVLDNVRSQRVYPLRLEELNTANGNIEATPELATAFAGMQAGIASYMEDVLLAVQEMLSETETDDPEGHVSDENYALSVVEAAVMKLAENAKGFSVMHDLLPVIASQLEQAGEFQGDDVRKGLVFAFQRSAFKSFDGSSSTQTVTRCPFSKVIAHLSNTVIEEGQNGGLAVAERTEPGALLVFIAKRIREIEAMHAPQQDGQDLAKSVPAP